MVGLLLAIVSTGTPAYVCLLLWVITSIRSWSRQDADNRAVLEAAMRNRTAPLIQEFDRQQELMTRQMALNYEIEARRAQVQLLKSRYSLEFQELMEKADEQRHYQPGYEPDSYLNRRLRDYGYPPQVIRAPSLMVTFKNERDALRASPVVYLGGGLYEVARGGSLEPIARHEPPQRENWRTRTPNAGPIERREG